MLPKSCIIMYIYPRATVTVNIYTVTVTRIYNILIISGSLVFFSLFSICTTNYPSSCSFFLWYTLPQTQNQKSTTIIKNQPQNQQQNQPLEQNRLIDDQWLWILDWRGDLDRWCGSMLMEIGDGLTEIGEIGVDGVLMMVLLGWRRLVDLRVLWCLWWSPCSSASGFWPWEKEEEKKGKKRKRKRQR